MSKTFTLAPKPSADLAANSPTLPAPKITTSVGGTPPILPNRRPLPLLILLINSEAINIEAVPAISLNDFKTGYTPCSSLI